MSVSMSPSFPPDELAKLGEKIYFENKESLERDNFGKFAAIEVESKDITVDADKTTAIQAAQVKHPGKLFYIVQIGNLKQSIGDEMNEVRRYGWAF